MSVFKFSDSSKFINKAISLMYNVSPNEIDVSGREINTATTNEITIIASVRGKTLCQCSIDHVPALRLEFWPSQAAAWITRARRWPQQTIVEQIVGRGCHLVPRSSEGGDAHSEWRYSFSKAEVIITKLRTAQQQLVYFLFKLYFYRYLKPLSPAEDDGKRLFSYLCKTTMLWQCERFPPEDDVWKTLCRGVDALLASLQRSLRRRRLWNYFLPEINLVENIDETLSDKAVEKITLIRRNLFAYAPYDVAEKRAFVEELQTKLDVYRNTVYFITLMMKS